MNRTFSTGSGEISSFRSSTSPGPGSGESSGKEGLDEGIAPSSATTSSAPPSRNTDGIDSGSPEILEGDEDGFDFDNKNYGFTGRRPRMAQDVVVTFLGTSSGGGPTRTRNCSSLVVDMLGDGTLWSECRSFL